METEFGKIRKRKWKWLRKKQEIKKMRLDIGEFFLKACLQHEFRETWPASQINKIDTLSIHGLGDGFSLQVVAGDTVMVTRGGRVLWISSDRDQINWGQKSKPKNIPGPNLTLKNFQKALNDITRSQIFKLFWIPPKSLLKSSYQKKILPKIFIPKKS